MSDTPETDALREAIDNGAATEAEMTSLAGKLEQERDEAREDAADWKVEYEIVAARLRGEKHPQDNGIIAKDEIIPKLIRERDEAAKLREALQSVMDWNPKPEYWERPDTVARFEADMARARKVLEQTEETKPHQKWWEVLEAANQTTKSE